jgi:nucleotide-binding universal stress UspA family protein
MSTRILVATDGSAAAIGALRVGTRLAERDGRPLDVLAVLEAPLLDDGAWFTTPGTLLGYLEQEQESLRKVVAEQIGGSAASRSELDVEIGIPTWAIARYAEEHDAGLIVMGKGEHGALGRWLGEDTALEVVRLARVPVLAVAPGAMELPRRAVVAIDFSEYSHDAAATVLDLLADGAELHLVHVAWEIAGGEEPREPEAWLTTYRAGARARLEQLAEELRSRRPVRVVTGLYTGERPARELLRITGELQADLVAAGSHGRGFFTRLLGGSVSNQVFREARCSVLVAPPRAESPELRHAATAQAAAAAPARPVLAEPPMP